jgi:D-alanine-D-alanine ligase
VADTEYGDETLRVALLYGGRSGEHEISIRSARSIYAALEKTHNVFPIFIDKQGFWWRTPEGRELPTSNKGLQEKIYIIPGVSEPSLFTRTAQLRVDIVFPVLHGTHGEDGIIQGVLESAGIPYVGANVASSAAGMDKVIMKALFAQAGLPMAPYVWFYKKYWQNHPDDCLDSVEKSFPYPVFAKPANLGSSVGINKAKNRTELRSAFEDAAKYDLKILAEKGLSAREIECSVLGNQEPKASLPGEIVPKRDFYDYVAKYIEDSTELYVPAQLEPVEIAKVQELSIRAFQAIGCSGMARVDLFLERETGSVYVNEINTIPGFTNISMYPKLWEVSGLPFPVLLDRLLELGLERFRDQSQLSTSFDLIQNP